MIKPCRRCKEEKPLAGYYVHKRMADGHLNICIECTKIRVVKHRIKNIDSIREYDRNRPNQKERVSQCNINNRLPKNRKRSKCRDCLGNAVRDKRIDKPTTCQDCGASGKIEGHHADYTKPLDVEWLCTTCHGARHRKYTYSKL